MVEEVEEEEEEVEQHLPSPRQLPSLARMSGNFEVWSFFWLLLVFLAPREDVDRAVLVEVHLG